MNRSIKFLLSTLSVLFVLGFSSVAFAQGADTQAVKTAGLALIESLVIYALIIAILLWLKIG